MREPYIVIGPWSRTNPSDVKAQDDRGAALRIKLLREQSLDPGFSRFRET